MLKFIRGSKWDFENKYPDVATNEIIKVDHSTTILIGLFKYIPTEIGDVSYHITFLL